MPSLFQPAFDFLMSHEDSERTGKVTNDSGGITKYGISSHAYPDLNIAKLTIEDAANIYRNDYFKPIRGYDYVSQDVANKLLDAAVNCGLKSAIKMAQECANLLGQTCSEDGVAGPITVAAINAIEPSLFLEKYRARLKAHYEQIAEDNPSEAKYLEGWLKRANA